MSTGVVFQARTDHFDYYFESLTVEFKPDWVSVLCIPHLEEQAKHHPMPLQTEVICPPSFFLITTQEKTGLFIPDLAPATEEMPCILWTVR